LERRIGREEQREGGIKGWSEGEEGTGKGKGGSGKGGEEGEEWR